MIVSLEGTLVSAAPLQAVIEAGGIGYEVNIPLTTAERLPGPGARVKVFTLAVYREDAQTLYGFATREDRDFFRLMVEKVSGVGPKVALSIMSRLSIPVLESAIASSNVELLARCPGIGRKTAERLVVELKDKLPSLGKPAVAPVTGGPAVSGDTRLIDAVSALLALGYKAADADKAVRKARESIGTDASTEALIKKALG